MAINPITGEQLIDNREKMILCYKLTSNQITDIQKDYDSSFIVINTDEISDIFATSFKKLYVNTISTSEDELEDILEILS